MHAFTYSAHPVSCAVGLETIAIYERENLIEARLQGKKLLQGFSSCLFDLVGDVRGLGMLRPELVEDKATKKAFDPAFEDGNVHQEAASALYSRIRGDIYLIAPPFVTTDPKSIRS